MGQLVRPHLVVRRRSHLLTDCSRKLRRLASESRHNALTLLNRHLLYGAVSASIFLAFEKRLANQLSVTTSHQTDHEKAPTISPAPALCLFALGLGILLPMLLA